MDHEISHYILKVFVWGAIIMITYEAMAASKRQSRKHSPLPREKEGE